MKKVNLLLIGVFASTILYGQNTNITYKVTNYSINGENYDYLALNENVSLVFYYGDNEELCFANYWRNTNSQSYGQVYALKVSDSPETRDEYATTQLKFTWYYFNTYDSKSGQAAVTITNIFIGNTIKFVGEIVVLSTNEILTFQGYLE